MAERGGGSGVADGGDGRKSNDVKSSDQETVIETATEAKEPPPPDVVQLCRETFQKSAEYLRGEMEGTIEDYKLLENMNKITIAKYSEMKQLAQDISTSLQDLNDKYKTLQPYLEQIDHIEENVSNLEQAAYKLDVYSKRLGNKVWKLVLRSPNYVPGTNKCDPICTCPDAVIHNVPLLYELTSDPREANPLNYSGNTDLEKVVATIQEGHRGHIRSVEPVEIQFSTLNLIWRPNLQVCCNFPSCHCTDPKYADYA